MEITTIDLSEGGLLTVTATGHATAVVSGFRDLSQMVLGPRGPWRISEMHGYANGGDPDDKMNWMLVSTLKDRRID